MKYSALYLILPATFHVKLRKIDYSTLGTVYSLVGICGLGGGAIPNARGAFLIVLCVCVRVCVKGVCGVLGIQLGIQGIVVLFAAVRWVKNDALTLRPHTQETYNSQQFFLE